MGSPWDNSDAFDAMFCDAVEISGVRPRGSSFRGSFATCTYPVEQVEPFGGNDAENDMRRFSVLLAKRGENAWNRKEPPQIGDKLTLPNGTKWKVSRVEDRLDWFEMEARSC